MGARIVVTLDIALLLGDYSRTGELMVRQRATADKNCVGEGVHARTART